MAFVVYTAFLIISGNFRKGIASVQLILQDREIIGYRASHFSANASSAAPAASSDGESSIFRKHRVGNRPPFHLPHWSGDEETRPCIAQEALYVDRIEGGYSRFTLKTDSLGQVFAVWNCSAERRPIAGHPAG